MISKELKMLIRLLEEAEIKLETKIGGTQQRAPEVEDQELKR